MSLFFKSALIAAGLAANVTQLTATEVRNFAVGKSPSGLFYYPDQKLLYVLCGTKTNGDHYLYAFKPDSTGSHECLITIPEAVKMSRVDGFYISGTSAYIADSQGPIYASSHLGGSVYEVEWTNPCECDATGSCAKSTASWSPTIKKTYTISAGTVGDGGTTDEYFRNSGTVIAGDQLYAVNGVHPVSGLTCCYPKSLISTPLSGDGSTVTKKWSFTGDDLGHHVDMEGLTCGSDNCATYIYIGDEYNYIYRLKLSESGAAAIDAEWYVGDDVKKVGDVPFDKGIEALAYSAEDNVFFAGIQQTGYIHVFDLSTDACGSDCPEGPVGSATLGAGLAAISVLFAQ